MLAGGLLGAAVAILLAPNLKPETRNRLWETGKSIGRTAGRLWRKPRDTAEEVLDEVINH